jgi:glycosyltransferase involved in cell wall biosynthesis
VKIEGVPKRPSNPLRVAYVVAYPYTLGGATRSLLELVENLPPTIAPLVIVAAPGIVADTCRARGLACQVLPAGASLLAFGKQALHWSARQRATVLMRDLLPFSLRLARLLRQQRVALVHTNCPRGTLLAGVATKLLRLPLVGHLRGRMPFGGRYARASELLCDRIITVCDAAQSSISHAARAKAVTVYNGTRDVVATPDAGSTLPWLRELRARGDLVLGCFASVTPFKGYHHLLAALALLRARGCPLPVTLCLGGVAAADEGYASWLETRKRELGLDSLTFAGFQSDPFRFYRECDLTVLPSVEREGLSVAGQRWEIHGNEGFPRTHLEAMAFGLPVVGTAIGGVEEQVVHEQTGLVVPPGDPHALSLALERLLRSPDLRQQLGRAGRARVLSEFSSQRCVQGVLQVYRELGALPAAS